MMVHMICCNTRYATVRDSMGHECSGRESKMATYNGHDVNTLEHWTAALADDTRQLNLVCAAIPGTSGSLAQTYLRCLAASLRCIEVDTRMIQTFASDNWDVENSTEVAPF